MASQSMYINWLPTLQQHFQLELYLPSKGRLEFEDSGAGSFSTANMKSFIGILTIVAFLATAESAPAESPSYEPQVAGSPPEPTYCYNTRDCRGRPRNIPDCCYNIMASWRDPEDPRKCHNCRSLQYLFGQRAESAPAPRYEPHVNQMYGFYEGCYQYTDCQGLPLNCIKEACCGGPGVRPCGGVGSLHSFKQSGRCYNCGPFSVLFGQRY